MTTKPKFKKEEYRIKPIIYRIEKDRKFYQDYVQEMKKSLLHEKTIGGNANMAGWQHQFERVAVELKELERLTLISIKWGNMPRSPD